MTVRRAPTTEIMSESQVSQDLLLAGRTRLDQAGPGWAWNYDDILGIEAGAGPDSKVSLSGKVFHHLEQQSEWTKLTPGTYHY